jgi:LysM repeat protein
MNRTSWLSIFITLVLVSSLSACVMSASNKPVPTSTANKAFPTPVPGSAMDNVRSQTQTAEAILSGQTGVTPPPEGATATPAAGEVNPPANAPTATQAAPGTEVQPTAVPPTEAPQPAAVSIPTLKRPQTYTLQRGEWPICIARRYNLNMADLLAINGLDMNSKPATGFVMQIPQSGTWSSGARALRSHPTNYTVVSGDTVNTVACSFGDVSPEGIIAANGLKSPYTLTAGNVIRIP